MPRTKRRITKRHLTALYNQLQAVMPVLEGIVQPETIGEEIPSYPPASANGHRYRFEKRGRETWAVLDGHDGDALVALTKYKKGAAEVVTRLEAYERRIAELSPPPPQTPVFLQPAPLL